MRRIILSVALVLGSAGGVSAADLCAPLAGTSAYSQCLTDRLVAEGRDLAPRDGAARGGPSPVSTPDYSLQRDEPPALVHDPDHDRQQAAALERLRRLTDYRTRRLADQVSRDNALQTQPPAGGGQRDPLAHLPTVIKPGH